MRTIFKTIVGSQAYGTSTPESDIDLKGVYIQPIKEILSLDGHIKQVTVTKDECYFEIERFLDLLRTGNPTVVELLFSPEDCILEKDPIYDILLKHRYKFLTKKLFDSFAGYATMQIKKSSGLDKKMNWEKNKVTRKEVLDFVYINDNGKTKPIKKWLEQNGKFEKHCGLVSMTNMRDTYSLYYSETIPYRGISIDKSNSVRLSSVPKGENCIGTVTFNKDGYTRHCKDYNSYEQWLKERNTARYVDIEGHNQKIDGKNLLHCRRLIDMIMELATTGEFNVKRPNAEYLLSIRKGKVDLKTIQEEAVADLEKLKELREKSNLPDEVSIELVNEILLEIRLLQIEEEIKFA